jgi:hypothetical protein
LLQVSRKVTESLSGVFLAPDRSTNVMYTSEALLVRQPESLRVLCQKVCVGPPLAEWRCEKNG